MPDTTPGPSAVQGLKQDQGCWAEFLKLGPGIAFQQSTAGGGTECSTDRYSYKRSCF